MGSGCWLMAFMACGERVLIDGYGHTAQKAPLPIRTAKLSCARRC